LFLAPSAPLLLALSTYRRHTYFDWYSGLLASVELTFPVLAILHSECGTTLNVNSSDELYKGFTSVFQILMDISSTRGSQLEI
jgi:hypothetical protein